MLQKICQALGAVKVFIGVAMIVMITGAVVHAQGDDADESSIRKAARLRQYPGGVDEEPLKVQDPLPQIKKDGDNEMSAPEPADAD